MLKPQINISLGRQRKTSTDDNTTGSSTIDLDKVGQIAAIAQCTAETTVKVVVGLYIAKKLVDTASQIAIIAAERHI